MEGYRQGDVLHFEFFKRNLAVVDRSGGRRNPMEGGGGGGVGGAITGTPLTSLPFLS